MFILRRIVIDVLFSTMFLFSVLVGVTNLLVSSAINPPREHLVAKLTRMRPLFSMYPFMLPQLGPLLVNLAAVTAYMPTITNVIC